MGDERCENTPDGGRTIFPNKVLVKDEDGGVGVAAEATVTPSAPCGDNEGAGAWEGAVGISEDGRCWCFDDPLTDGGVVTTGVGSGRDAVRSCGPCPLASADLPRPESVRPLAGTAVPLA